MEAKETNYKNVLKTNIIQFLSYGILLSFIFVIVVLLIKYSLYSIWSTELSLAFSLISSILIFYMLRFTCNSSTLEALKNNSLNEENSKNFLRKMNSFFVICTMISIIVCVWYLVINSAIFVNAISKAYEQYNVISVELAEKIVNSIKEEYHNSISSKIYSTIIIELSIAISFISLIPYQKKLLNKYNKAKKGC